MSAPLNFQTLFELDTTPETTATYVRLGDGITSASPAMNEKIDQKAYLDDDGGQTSEVTGFQLVYAFSGDRIPGNAAQDYVFGKLLDLGSARHTNFRVTDAGGTVISGECTIANIQPPGGDANNPAAIGFELHLNGKPSKVDPTTPTALTAVVGPSATVFGCTKFTATAGAGNHLAYRLTASNQASVTKGRMYVSQATNYTSGDNIPATAGQYLNMYELDAYNHIVKFASEALDAADIYSL